MQPKLSQPKFSVKRGRSTTSATIPGRCPEKAVVMHAVDTFVFLLPEVDREYNASEFAAVIREYSSHPRAEAIAAAVEKADQIITAQ